MSGKIFVLEGKGSISHDGLVIRKGEQVAESSVKQLPLKFHKYFKPYKTPKKPADALKAAEMEVAKLEAKVADLQKINSDLRKKVKVMEKQIEELTPAESKASEKK
ncbi:MAG: hypothetical protein J7L22_00285 [Candidatus Marinimicrobia bacterium]|nr:hypothetical protein [Candidatus Neomarinimicrobiota bacterium]